MANPFICDPDNHAARLEELGYVTLPVEELEAVRAFLHRRPYLDMVRTVRTRAGTYRLGYYVPSWLLCLHRARDGYVRERGAHILRVLNDRVRADPSRPGREVRMLLRHALYDAPLAARIETVARLAGARALLPLVRECYEREAMREPQGKRGAG